MFSGVCHVSRPAEAVFYNRFQVGKCACFFYVLLTCQGVRFIWMLVLTLGVLLLTGDELGQRLGAFQIICQMMDLIGAELTCASNVGQLDAIFFIIMICMNMCAWGCMLCGCV